ncbi:MAG: hypothetical protein IT376_04850, partial [Polyangiaceae bacterium]|nr:hypothetical protein [Polyangiaceae bacterium]
ARGWRAPGAAALSVCALVVGVASAGSARAHEPARARLEAVRARFVVEREVPWRSRAMGGPVEWVSAVRYPRERFGRGERGEPRAVLRPAWAAVEAVLPPSAGGWISVRRLDTAAEARFRWEGLADHAAEHTAGVVLYPGVVPGGGDVIVQALEDGVEDYLVLEEAPRGGRLGLTLRWAGAAGLRLVADSLELLDAAGTPLLRMHAPIAVGAAGEVYRVRVRVSGCRYDSDPRGPWGRPVTPPGAEECTVSFELPPGLAYPALLDPSWTSAGTYSSPECEVTGLERLPSGRVLMPGFVSQLYDPGTNTWSAAEDPPVPRCRTYVASLPDGVVVIAGGRAASAPPVVTRDADGYVESTGEWIPAPRLAVARMSGRGVELSDGRMMVIDGLDSSSDGVRPYAEVLDPATGWRSYSFYDSWLHGAAVAAVDGGVVVSGGLVMVAGATQVNNSMFRIDNDGGRPVHAPGLDPVLHFAEAVVLTGNRVGVFGGVIEPREEDEPFAGVQVIALDQIAWSDAGGVAGAAPWVTYPLPARSGHSLVSLPGGDILLVGGTADLAIGSIRVHEDLAWEGIPMAYERRGGRAVLLADGTVLAAGGRDALGELRVAERLSFAEPPDAGAPDAGAADSGEGADAAGWGPAAPEPGTCDCRAAGAAHRARLPGAWITLIVAGGWLARRARRAAR